MREHVEQEFPGQDGLVHEVVAEDGRVLSQPPGDGAHLHTAGF